jgi:signal transduction histidine kinase
VEIGGGYTHPRRQGPRRLRIAVTSQGVRIEPHELSLIRTRGFQGAEAALSGQGGSGIGLWIVDQIMLAMNGELDIQPSNREARTTISLILPVE